MFVTIYVTGSTGKTEDRSKLLTKLDLFKKHNITTVFMKKKWNTSLAFKDQLILICIFRCFKTKSSFLCPLKWKG